MDIQLVTLIDADGGQTKLYFIQMCSPAFPSLETGIPVQCAAVPGGLLISGQNHAVFQAQNAQQFPLKQRLKGKRDITLI